MERTREMATKMAKERELGRCLWRKTPRKKLGKGPKRKKSKKELRKELGRQMRR
jgi:hypothetical protein